VLLAMVTIVVDDAEACQLPGRPVLVTGPPQEI